METPTVNCPSCGKTVVWQASAQYRPFCSQRCYQLDLGDWLTESHRIQGPAIDPMAPQSDDECDPER